jgi:hypothetical protein
MKKYESINVKPQTKKTIDRLAKKHEKSLVDFTEDMASYFDKTGVNPNDLQILSPAEELKKFRDTIIAFLRKQEKEFILPVFSRVDTLAIRLIKYIDEEAPKKSEKATNLSGTIIKDLAEKEKKADDITSLKISEKEQPGEDYRKLKIEYDSLNLKYDVLKEYFTKIMNNTEFKTTSLTPKPVIELPKAQINEFKAYVKKL